MGKLSGEFSAEFSAGGFESVPREVDERTVRKGGEGFLNIGGGTTDVAAEWCDGFSCCY